MSKRYAGPKSKEVRDELEALDGSLLDLKYQKEYDVPPGFFAKQKNDLAADVNSIKPIKKSRVRFLWKPLMGVAAAFVLGIMMIQNVGTSDSSIESIENLEVATLEDYLIDETEYLDSDIAVDYDLIDLID